MLVGAAGHLQLDDRHQVLSGVGRDGDRRRAAAGNLDVDDLFATSAVGASSAAATAVPGCTETSAGNRLKMESLVDATPARTTPSTTMNTSVNDLNIARSAAENVQTARDGLGIGPRVMIVKKRWPHNEGFLIVALRGSAVGVTVRT